MTSRRRLALVGFMLLVVITIGLVGYSTTQPGWNARQSGAGVYKTVVGSKD